MRVIGGRTNVWGRQSYRLSEQDLKGNSFDGFGDDWPLDYTDLASVLRASSKTTSASPDMAESVPELPDSKFHAADAADVRRDAAAHAREGRSSGARSPSAAPANLTKPINGRPPCHYCGPCERGCVTHSYFNSAFTTVADALKTGNCTHIPNAMVYKVLMDPDAEQGDAASSTSIASRASRGKSTRER